MTTPYLHADVTVRRGAHTMTAAFDAEPGEVIAVIGPNGTGKTTLLHALAGLVGLDDGAVTVAGRTWAGPGFALPVPERRLGMVFQGRSLFPHLTARQDVAFGLRSRGRDRRESDRIARAWLDRLGVGDLADRRPDQLSGGQAQRVAIARALAGEPELLLLDEPMAALDVHVATALRIELAEHLADYPGVAVLVTHDALDALTVAHRVLVLDDGRIAQDGTPAEVSQRPRTSHVARLVGLNVLRGTADDTGVLLDGGQHLETPVPPSEHPSGAVLASFSPAAVTLTPTEPSGSARNRWPVTVRSVAPHGGAVRVHLSLDAQPAAGLIADVTPQSTTGLGLVPGRTLWASVKATEVAVYSAAKGP